MKKIKLAFLAPEFLPTWGGVGIYSVNLIKELSKGEDMEIHVLTPERGKDYNKEKILKYFNNRIYIHNISKANDTFFYNFTFQLAVLKNFEKLHKKYNFDLIHSANLVHMPDIWLKFRKQKIPSIVTIHTTIKGQVSGFLQSNKNFFNMANSEKMSILAYPYISILERYYLKTTENLLTVSKKFASYLKEIFPHKNIEATYNGIDAEIFNYNKIEGYGKFKCLEGKKRIVLYAGRLITQKGIKLFIKLMKEIDVHFVIAGTGNEKFFLRLVKKNNIDPNRYTFLGAVNNSDLPWLYKSANVFVLPSYYENFPISLLEAMAMKTACLTSNAGAIEEIIENGKNGFIFQIGDYEGMKWLIVKLLKDEELRQKIAQEGYKKVLNNFTAEKMANKTYNFYKKILNENTNH